MAESFRSLPEILRQRQLAGFVGREVELERFRDNLAFPADDERRKILFAVHGDGGVGKTFLVARMRQVAAECGCLTAVVDETAYDVAEVMAAISRQLNRQGARLKRFDQRYAIYRKLQYEPATGVSVDDGAASLVTQTAVRVGLGAARGVPGAGAVTEFIDPRAAAESADRLRAAVAKKLRKRDDVKLLLSPVEELTCVFAAGLWQLDRPLAWFFDSYERTSGYLGGWLRGLFDGAYAQFPADLVITVAGRARLDSSLWSAHLRQVADVPLAPFTEAEVRQLLAQEGLTDERMVTRILKDSGGLPLAVAMLAAKQPTGRPTPSEVNASVVERFLHSEEPARRDIALKASLPRRFDEDVLAVLAGAADATESFNWLAHQPFVTLSDDQCHYHDVVR